jgi:uroporphyrinogen-III synthase
LKSNGAEIDEVIVYRTVAPQNAETNKLKEMLQRKEIDAVTFFSPSSMENFVAVVPVELLSGAAIAAIGRTTSDAAAQFGLNMDVIANPSTSEGMVDALRIYFEKRK